MGGLPGYLLCNREKNELGCVSAQSRTPDTPVNSQMLDVLRNCPMKKQETQNHARGITAGRRDRRQCHISRYRVQELDKRSHGAIQSLDRGIL
jgi:hypothetical protein